MANRELRGDCPPLVLPTPRAVVLDVALALLVPLLGFGSRTATAQAPAPANPANPSREAPRGEIKPVTGDLTTRYLLRERYTTKDEPGKIGQYQVGFKETEARISTDRPNGAPRREEIVVRGRFTERPVAVGPVDDRLVNEVVRRFEGTRITPDPFEKASGPSSIDNLTVWYTRSTSGVPPLIVLTPGRTLLEQEFRFALHVPFVPSLSFVLPDGPVHLGDVWAVSRAGCSALVKYEVQTGSLRARLAEIRPNPDGSGEVAVIDITGQVVVDQMNVALHAQAEFQFQRVPVTTNDAEKAEDAPIEAQGGITKVRLASAGRLPADPETGEPGPTIRRELLLERRWPGDGPPLSAPDPRPEPTAQNSWLIYEDPKGRFHFQHPENIEIHQTDDPNHLELHRNDSNGFDLVELDFRPGSQPRPDTLFQQFFEEYRAFGLDVLPTASERLPAADWPEGEVYHVEAVLTPNRPTPGAPGRARFHLDAYLILFRQNASLSVRVRTAREEVKSVRKAVEQALATFRLGPLHPNAANASAPRP